MGRLGSASRGARMDAGKDLSACAGELKSVKLVAHLAVQPELGAVAEVGGKADGRISRDASLACDDGLDAALRDTRVERQPRLTQIHGLQEVLKQNFSRMDGGHTMFHTFTPSVVVHDLHSGRPVAFPPEADAPLIIDANAVLSRPISSESFQTVSRRDAQIVQTGGIVQQLELAHGCPLDVRRQTGYPKTIEQALRPLILEIPYHTN